MRPAFFQNSKGGGPREVVLDIGRYGDITPMFYQGGTYLIGQMSYLANASSVKVNYSYLGGVHLCNYVASKQTLGPTVRWTVRLNTITYNNYTVWDVNNAAFIPQVGFCPSNLPIKSPLRELIIDISIITGQATITKSETLLDYWMDQNGYPNSYWTIMWSNLSIGGQTVDQGLYKVLVSKSGSTWSYGSPVQANKLTLSELSLDAFNNNNIPQYTTWCAMATSPYSINSSFDAYAIYESGGLIHWEAVALYDSTFNINSSPGSHGYIATIDTNGSTLVDGSTQYRSLV